jgi:isopenicillin N synthase-like dioxygenase
MGNQLSTGIPSVEWPAGDGTWSAEETRRVAGAVDSACRHAGYFFLHHHGVSPGLIAAGFEETRRFYDRPLGEKSRFNCTTHSQFLGYRGLGAEKSRLHSGAEACEQYRIGNIVATPAARALVGLYHQPFGQSTVLFEELIKVGTRLMSTCTMGLGLAATSFDGFMEAPMHRLGLNRYPVGAGQTIGNSVSYAMTPHVDHAVLTMLTQDEPGLEVLSPEGEWLDVPLIPDALFVFLGDYMQRWTNGVYRAIPHRVREVSRNRMSLQYKHKPSYATVVAPLSPFVDEGHPARYEAFDTGHQYAELLRSLLAGAGPRQKAAPSARLA